VFALNGAKDHKSQINVNNFHYSTNNSGSPNRVLGQVNAGSTLFNNQSANDNGLGDHNAISQTINPSSKSQLQNKMTATANSTAAGMAAASNFGILAENTLISSKTMKSK
jgi:hypothetical protein